MPLRPCLRSIAALASAVAATTAANPAAAAPPAVDFQGLRPLHPTALALDEEHIDISCPPADDILRCTAIARHVIANPSAETVETDAPVVALGLAGVQIVRDGQPSTEPPFQVHVALAAGARSTIVVSFPLAFTGRQPPSPLAPGAELTAMEARHPVLGGDTREAPVHPVIFRWSDGWAAVGARSFDVHYPAGWKLHGSQWRAQGAVAERTVTREISSGDTPVDVDLRKVRSALPVTHGGPVIAAGSALGEGFRMRYAYEVGLSSWLVPSLATDVDYAGLLVLTPTVDAATSAKLPMPSWAAGVGLPFRLKPDTRAGARLKLSAVAIVGIEATIDYYPSDGDWETTLAGRVSM